ncbi:putative uncharacterized protein [Roseburia sp. CAG:380]|mgnify:FL=1|uniref:DUF6128 domain-containing protein n=1 Tax=Roseburia sp. AM59-24XD TaxID=2293138 RepID=UPI00033A80D3|nr:DUF6128 domain-containing protein [Roseburia sp. AM59-24XD]RHP86305.1 hypothetical protein DXA20_06840 [Roseburia sp. AM59-24XD]CDC95141.1 putative uncharacterized protein [Roseburia sp. CAG:380]
MSGYQRMVSYLYRYDKGIKGKNTGYARIERNDRRCRVTIRLQDTVSVSPSVFFFIQNEGGMQRIPAGKLARNGSGFAGRVETPVDRMAGSEYAFDRIDGIYLSGPENVFYATTWKDITVSGAAPEKEADGWKAEDDRDDGNRSDAGSGSEESRPQAVNTASTEIRQESERAEPVQRRQDALDDALQAATGLEEASFAEASSVEACSRRERPDFGERMLSVFPKMYPFEIDEMGECVRIDLKDIGNLPVAYWSLAGNPFLLRGYYCYRHLIFACIGRQEYAVGVPGIYSEENSKWAKECRMLRFQPLSRVKDRHGAFGYWLIAVHAQE